MSKKKSRKSHKKSSTNRQFAQKNISQSNTSVYAGRDNHPHSSASSTKTTTTVNRDSQPQSKAAEVQALHDKYQSAITKTERKTQVASRDTAAKDSTLAEKVILYDNKPKTTTLNHSYGSHATSTTKTGAVSSSASKSSDGFVETPKSESKKSYTPAPYLVVEEADSGKDEKAVDRVETNKRTHSIEQTEESHTVNEPDKLGTVSKTPTFEDWQSEQKQRIEEAFEKKQAELKLKTVELELNEAVKPHRHFGRWLAASFAALLVLVACGGGTWWLLTQRHSADEVEIPVTGQIAETIDYGWRVVDADGNEFTPVYQRGGLEKDLFIKFADLKCNDQCTNVQNPRFADQELIPGLDYNLVGENVSFTLYADFLEKFEAGTYELTFDYIDTTAESASAEKQKIGLHITIEAVELVCAESQTLQDGVCVDEKGEEVAKPTVRILPMPEKNTSTEQNSDQQNANSSDDQKPAEPAPEQPSTSTDQLTCERRKGPKYLTIIHWATDAEKEQAIATGKIDPTLTFIEGGFNTATKLATMKWANGSCRPAVKAEYLPDSQPSIAILMSLDSFHIIGGHLISYVEKYPNQDLLIWIEADGSVKVEVVANGYAVLEY